MAAPCEVVAVVAVVAVVDDMGAAPPVVSLNTSSPGVEGMMSRWCRWKEGFIDLLVKCGVWRLKKNAVGGMH